MMIDRVYCHSSLAASPHFSFISSGQSCKASLDSAETSSADLTLMMMMMMMLTSTGHTSSPAAAKSRTPAIPLASDVTGRTEPSRQNTTACSTTEANSIPAAPRGRIGAQYVAGLRHALPRLLLCGKTSASTPSFRGKKSSPPVGDTTRTTPLVAPVLFTLPSRSGIHHPQEAEKAQHLSPLSSYEKNLLPVLEPIEHDTSSSEGQLPLQTALEGRRFDTTESNLVRTVSEQHPFCSSVSYNYSSDC
ncbi:unnamed protein product [Protopolystoma xenopodis]|uniref:Uncharacterized protein n=1 Tax=Protopolystoma xenopodis TaxID=117903 RepID=A0A3S5FGD8_9PLAT|nr:unnamed protein product [Protopolystoma xenopodis]